VLLCGPLLVCGLSAQEPPGVQAQEQSRAELQSGPVAQFTGALQDANGRPITGRVQATFAVYDTEAGGKPLWQETQEVEADREGRYDVRLGSTRAEGLPQATLESGNRWLAVSVDGREVGPRVQVARNAAPPPAGSRPASAPVRIDRIKLRKIKLNIEHAYSLGQMGAPLVLVEFTDYQCPECKRFHFTVFDELKRNFIDSGKVRFVSLDLPLEEIHPQAWKAAQAGRCAGEQGKFWEMRHRLIMTHPLRDETYGQLARECSLDLLQFETCFKKERYSKEIRSDLVQVRYLGIEGTPTFILGRPLTEGVQGVIITGRQSYPVFEALVNQLLDAQAGDRDMQK
jgi:predicted DsbA family dithiol-disulfide isomerase